eukprot:c13525_g1_i1 orf=249-422(-)
MLISLSLSFVSIIHSSLVCYWIHTKSIRCLASSGSFRNAFIQSPHESLAALKCRPLS